MTDLNQILLEPRLDVASSEVLPLLAGLDDELGKLLSFDRPYLRAARQLCGGAGDAAASGPLARRFDVKAYATYWLHTGPRDGVFPIRMFTNPQLWSGIFSSEPRTWREVVQILLRFKDQPHGAEWYDLLVFIARAQVRWARHALATRERKLCLCLAGNRSAGKSTLQNHLFPDLDLLSGSGDTTGCVIETHIEAGHADISVEAVFLDEEQRRFRVSQLEQFARHSGASEQERRYLAIALEQLAQTTTERAREVFAGLSRTDRLCAGRLAKNARESSLAPLIERLVVRYPLERLLEAFPSLRAHEDLLRRTVVVDLPGGDTDFVFSNLLTWSHLAAAHAVVFCRSESTQTNYLEDFSRVLRQTTGAARPMLVTHTRFDVDTGINYLGLYQSLTEQFDGYDAWRDAGATILRATTGDGASSRPLPETLAEQARLFQEQEARTATPEEREAHRRVRGFLEERSVFKTGGLDDLWRRVVGLLRDNDRSVASAREGFRDLSDTLELFVGDRQPALRGAELDGRWPEVPREQLQALLRDHALRALVDHRDSALRRAREALAGALSRVEAVTTLEPGELVQRLRADRDYQDSARALERPEARLLLDCMVFVIALKLQDVRHRQRTIGGPVASFSDPRVRTQLSDVLEGAVSLASQPGFLRELIFQGGATKDDEQQRALWLAYDLLASLEGRVTNDDTTGAS